MVPYSSLKSSFKTNFNTKNSAILSEYIKYIT